MSEREEWRPVPGYSYEASSLGRIRNSKGRVMRQYLHLGRWRALKLQRDGRQHTFVVHALIAKIFLGGRPTARHVVCHWDGDGSNNAVCNLRWGTYKDNEADKLRHGRRVFGERVNTARFTADQVRAIRQSGERTGVLAERFSVNRTTITDIRRGHTWRHVA